MTTIKQTVCSEYLGDARIRIGDVFAELPARAIPDDLARAGRALYQCVLHGYGQRAGEILPEYTPMPNELDPKHPIYEQLYNFQNPMEKRDGLISVPVADAKDPHSEFDFFHACAYADSDFTGIEHAYKVGNPVEKMARVFYRTNDRVKEPLLIQKFRGKRTALTVGKFAIGNVGILPGSLVDIGDAGMHIKDTFDTDEKGDILSYIHIGEITDAAYLRPTLYTSQENGWPMRLERMKRLAGTMLHADLV